MLKEAMHSNQPKQPHGQFYVGPSTAAYHTEGGNAWADFYTYDKFPENGACQSYKRYREDHDLLELMGLTAYRISLEWSRIEKKPGEFDEKEIKHYQEVIEDLRSRGIEPIVTLHHFTNPLWLEEKGGWERDDVVDIFLKYVEYVTSRISGVKWWNIINEPNVFTICKYAFGGWHPHKRNVWKAFRVYHRLIDAHKKAYKLMKERNPEYMLSTALQYINFVPNPVNFLPQKIANIFLTHVARFFFNHYFYAFTLKHLDFISLNFYMTLSVSLTKNGPAIHPDLMQTGSLVMESTPEEFAQVLRTISEYDKPILITEHGIPTPDNIRRSQFIRDSFQVIEAALKGGLKIVGYLFFTLLNGSVEWYQGTVPQFGLADYDPKTGERALNESGYTFKQCAQQLINTLERK